MYFETTGLKQVGTDETAKQEKIQLLFEANTLDEVNNLLKFLGIVKLSAKIFEYSVQDFGNIFFIINYKGTSYKIFIKKGLLSSDTIKDGYIFTKTILNTEIETINDAVNPIEEETIQSFLEKIKNSEKNKDTEDKKTKKKDTEIDDKKLIELKEFISATLIEADQLLEKSTGKVSPMILKHLKDSVDDLKKLRMGSNMEKLTYNFEKLINFMEEIELEYIEALKNIEINNQKESFVTDLDIIREYNKFSKAQKKQKASQLSKVKIDKGDLYYRLMGKPGIFLKLIGKDTSYKLQSKLIHSDDTLFDMIKYIEIFVIFILLELNIYFIYNYFIGNPLDGYFNYTRPIGLIGLIIFFGKNFASKNTKKMLILYFTMILIFFVSYYFIWSNFGL